jgi:UDP-galactopyranose mutase
MFRRMLDHPNIEVRLSTGFEQVRHSVGYERLIYTGPIDAYFNYRYGKLPYRSLRFDHKTLDREWFQVVGTVNYPQTEAYTRITEYKHLTGQLHHKTTITYEYPSAEGDPYYPIPREENQELYRKYEALARKQDGAFFVGRLATYRYYNMDQVIGQALATFDKIEDMVPRGIAKPLDKKAAARRREDIGSRATA